MQFMFRFTAFASLLLATKVEGQKQSELSEENLNNVLRLNYRRRRPPIP